MKSDFTVSADRKRGLLSIELSGFLTVSDVSAFDARRQEAHNELQCAPNSHVTMIDVTACKIQPQEVVSAFVSVIANSRQAPRRLAFVVGSSLAKMQVRRIINGHPVARCFDDRRTAESWLFE